MFSGQFVSFLSCWVTNAGSSGRPTTRRRLSFRVRQCVCLARLYGWNTPECNGTPVRVTCGYLEDARHHRVMPPWPHLLDDVGVGLGDLSLHSQRVGEVQLIHIGVLQEVLRQGRSVTQTLQRDEDTRSYYTSASDGQPIRTELA